ncbi:MAG: BtpA/SgcQ family protein, partial [Thermoanaerobaculia bacterium]
MLTREQFAFRFGRRAIFGMVHLRALPGSPMHTSISEVIDAAKRDALALRDGGCSGIVFENFGDRPFARGRVDALTVAAMTRVITEVMSALAISSPRNPRNPEEPRNSPVLPRDRGTEEPRDLVVPPRDPLVIGVNVLRNDARSALAIAAATGAAFIRVNVHTGAMLTDQGIIEGEAYETMRMRAAVAPDVFVFADHLVKHAVQLAEVEPVQSAKDLRLRGLADALIVTGAETGAAADPARLTALRAVLPDAPLL